MHARAGRHTLRRHSKVSAHAERGSAGPARRADSARRPPVLRGVLEAVRPRIPPQAVFVQQVVRIGCGRHADRARAAGAERPVRGLLPGQGAPRDEPLPARDDDTRPAHDGDLLPERRVIPAHRPRLGGDLLHLARDAQGGPGVQLLHHGHYHAVHDNPARIRQGVHGRTAPGV